MRDTSQLRCETGTGSRDVAVDSLPHAAEPNGRVRVAMKASEYPLSNTCETELTTNRLLEEPMTQRTRYLALGHPEKKIKSLQ